MRMPDLSDLIQDLQLAKQIAIEDRKPNALVIATIAQAKLLGLDKADSTHDAKPQPVVFNITGISANDASKAYQDMMQ